MIPIANTPLRALIKEGGYSRRSKGQIEIMGLVIIVLLVSVGFLFLLSFQAHSTGTTQTPNPARSYDDQQLGTNFVAAALKTNICKTSTLEDLIIACASHTGEFCTTPSTPSNPDPACTESFLALDQMMHASLQTWGVRYNLTITYPDPTINQVVISSYCGEHNSSYPSVPFPLPIYRTGQNVIVSMRICK